MFSETFCPRKHLNTCTRSNEALFCLISNFHWDDRVRMQLLLFFSLFIQVCKDKTTAINCPYLIELSKNLCLSNLKLLYRLQTWPLHSFLHTIECHLLTKETGVALGNTRQNLSFSVQTPL